jgi:hypothetical protein
MTRTTKSAQLKYVGLAAAGVVLLALLPTPSPAAPIGSVNDARLPSAVTQVGYQCWWADGDRHCANIKGGDDYRGYEYDRPYRDHYRPRHGYYLPYYGYARIYRPIQRPEAYWTGSQRWWKSMELWGRTNQQ